MLFKHQIILKITFEMTTIGSPKANIHTKNDIESSTIFNR